MDIEIKPIRKQKRDEDYKSPEKLRTTAHIHYFKMKQTNPEKYQDKVKKNKERYHANKKVLEDARRIIEHFKNITISV